MATYCKTYRDLADAQQAVDALVEAGVPGGQIRLVQGMAERDAHTVPEGKWTGQVRQAERVGRWDNRDEQTQREGTYADTEGHLHDARFEREGSYADIDRDEVRTAFDGVEQVTVADHPALIAELTRAGLDRTAAEHDVEALHHGQSLLIVTYEGDDQGRVQGLLDRY